MKRAKNGLRVFGNLGQILAVWICDEVQALQCNVTACCVRISYYWIADRIILLDLFKNGLYNTSCIQGAPCAPPSKYSIKPSSKHFKISFKNISIFDGSMPIIISCSLVDSLGVPFALSL